MSRSSQFSSVHFLGSVRGFRKHRVTWSGTYGQLER